MTSINTNTHRGPSFSFGNRIARGIWNCLYWILFFPSPRFMHRWRSFLLKSMGARIGKHCHIYPGARIWAPWNLICADEVGIASGAIIYNQAPISLGHRCVISQGAHLCSGTHDYNQEGFPLVAYPITIKANVWVAAEAFVHGGVTVEEGCVVGARAVVAKDMPAWSVCAGNPCKVIKERALKK